MRSFFALFLCMLSPATTSAGEKIEFKILAEGLLEQRLRLADPDVNLRYARLKTLFEETGCTGLKEQPVRGSKLPNLICPPSELGKRRILVGAHYDSAGGDGVIDNWTGAILLPSLAQFMREQNRQHAFEFIGFAAEEKGLLGSKAYLKALSKEEKQQIAAVVTMDSLGLGPTKVWPNSSNKELTSMALSVAASMKLGFAGVNLDTVGSTDSMTFHKAGIPVLSLHSVTQETWPLINSSGDVWASLQWTEYYNTHKLVSALLTYLDQKLP